VTGGGTFQAAVVEHHQLFVLGQPHVKLDAVGAQIKGFSEGWNGVLRGAGDIAAVGDYQWKRL
jgi:hypothetical protein